MDNQCPTNAGKITPMNKKTYCPVTLEPELEEEAALLTPVQRLDLARKFERWSRQLRVSAVILKRVYGPKPQPSLKVLTRRRLVLN
jgi:hypothetical protein